MTKLRIILLGGTVGFLAFASGDRIVVNPGYHFIAPAGAIVGRPLTPVSYAGVARRTVRRGMY